MQIFFMKNIDLYQIRNPKQQKRARLASHPECFHNGIILIVYVIQKSCAKIRLFCDICK